MEADVYCRPVFDVLKLETSERGEEVPSFTTIELMRLTGLSREEVHKELCLVGVEMTVMHRPIKEEGREVVEYCLKDRLPESEPVRVWGRKRVDGCWYHYEYI